MSFYRSRCLGQLSQGTQYLYNIIFHIYDINDRYNTYNIIIILSSPKETSETPKRSTCRHWRCVRILKGFFFLSQNLADKGFDFALRK